MLLSTTYLINRKEYVEVPEKYGSSFPLYSLCYRKKPTQDFTAVILLSFLLFSSPTKVNEMTPS